MSSKIGGSSRNDASTGGGATSTSGYPANPRIVNPEEHSGFNQDGYRTVRPGPSETHSAPSPNKGKA